MSKMKRHREAVRELLNVERARARASYPEISERLREYGIEQSATNLRNKTMRGQMEAGLFLAVLDVLGVKQVEVPDLIGDLRK
jgi:hypothetical protein